MLHIDSSSHSPAATDAACTTAVAVDALSLCVYVNTLSWDKYERYRM